MGGYPAPFFISLTMHLLSEVVEFSKRLNVYSVLMDEDVRTKFIELYYYAFEMYPECTACAGDIENAIFKFMWLIKKHNGQMNLQKSQTITKYSMKPKVRLYSNSLGMMVTEYNCTDAIAEALMKENPKYAELFIVNIPEEKTDTFTVSNDGDEIVEVETKHNKRGRKKKFA